MIALMSNYGRETRMLGAVTAPRRLVCETRLVGRRLGAPAGSRPAALVPVYQRRCRWALGLSGLDAALPVPPAPNGGTPPSFDVWLAAHPELAPIPCSVVGNMTAGSPEYGCVAANAAREAARTAAWAAATAQYNYQSCVRGWTINVNASGGDKAIGTRPDLSPTYCDSYLTPASQGGAIQTTPLVQRLAPAGPTPAQIVAALPPVTPKPATAVTQPAPVAPAAAGGVQPGATPGVTPAAVTPVNADGSSNVIVDGSGPGGGFSSPLAFLRSDVHILGFGIPWWVLLAGGGVALYAFTAKKGRH